MPFRLDEYRAKIQFITSAAMPNQIYEACVKTACVSNTRYVQEAVCRRLSADLNIPYEDLIAALPPTRGNSATLKFRDQRSVGPANTVEEVR